MHPAIFLDRDGVIIENRPGYVRLWSDVDIFPEAIQALNRAAQSPYKIIVVTNQSVVGRGIISLEDAQEINRQLVDTIQKSGGRIDGVYMCTHHPDDGCTCRKPEIGLIQQAARDHNLDLGLSILIGDAMTDLVAAKAAGIPLKALVLTGRGRMTEDQITAKDIQGVSIYKDILMAITDFIADSNN
ncbi:MAG: D-glycero-alpha-D-manno-heptose-1,7-bisphosphate 7-phosphatase [Anaerolineales bacterium]|jgi:D-glycero-D-manno-heptose 1,7-bisphosphate phosphatase